MDDVKIGFLPLLPDVTDCFYYNWRKGTEVAMQACKRPGLSVDITHTVCTFLRLNCTFVLTPHFVFGTKTKNGSFNGLVRDVMDGKYDVGFPQFTPNSIRHEAVDFSASVRHAHFYWITRMPEKQTFEFNSIFAFNRPIWLTILLSLIVISVSGWVLSGWTNNIICSFSIFDSLLDGALLFVKQGPLGTYGNIFKMILTSWGVACIVLSSLYSSLILIESLTSSYPLPFSSKETLAQCIRKFHCKMMFTDPAANEMAEIFRSKDLGNLALASALRRNPPVFANTYGKKASLIYESKKTFVVLNAQLARMVPMKRVLPECSLFAIKKPHGQRFEGVQRDVFIFRKRDPLIRRFNIAIVWMQSAGIIENLDNLYLGNSITEQKKCFEDFVEAKPLYLKIYSGAAIPLGFCLLAALLALIYEVKNRQQEKDIASDTSVDRAELFDGQGSGSPQWLLKKL